MTLNSEHLIPLKAMRPLTQESAHATNMPRQPNVGQSAVAKLRSLLSYFGLLLCFMACQQNDKIILAVVGDETGENRYLGRQLKFAANYFAKEVLVSRQGNPIETQFYNDNGNPDVARRVAMELVSDPRVVAVVGHATSATTRAAQDIYGLYNMPLIAPIATYSGLTQRLNRDGRRNAVRMIPSNQQQAALIADLVEQLNFKTAQNLSSDEQARPAVLVYYEPSEYGLDLGDRIQEALWNKGLDVRRKKKLEVNATGQLRTQPARDDVRDFEDVGIVVFAGYAYQAKDLVREIAGFDPTIIFILTDGCKDDDFFNHFGQPAYTAYLTFVAPEWTNEEKLRQVGGWTDPDRVRDLMVELSQRFSEEEGVDKVAGYVPIAVDAINLAYDIADSNRSDWSTPRELRLLELKELRAEGRKHTGMFRDYNFTSYGELRKGKAYLYKAKKLSNTAGVFEQIEPPAELFEQPRSQQVTDSNGPLSSGE